MDSGIGVLCVGVGSVGFDPTLLERRENSLTVFTTTTADECIDRLDERAIDCVVSADELPDSTGIDLLRRIRDADPDLPLVLVADQDAEVDASDAFGAGVSDYLRYRPESDPAAVLTERIQNAVEQFRAQRRLREEKRISSVIRKINRALIGADSSANVEQAVCDILSDSEPYLTACIADVDPDTMRVEPRVWSGAARGYFEDLDMVVADDAPGRRAPGGRAYHDREIAVSQDISQDSRYEKWRSEAAERGFRALAVVPLEYDNDLYGLLTVFADRPQAFDDSERQLLSELGDDIALALHAQRLRADLRETTSRLEALFEQSPDMIHIHDTDGTLTDPNPRLCEKTGYDENTLTGMKVSDLDPTIESQPDGALWNDMGDGDTRRHEGEYRRADGTSFPVETHTKRLELADGVRFVVISRDITDQKRRQRELERYEHLIESLPVGVFRTTLDGDIVSVNPRFVSLYGGKSEASFEDVTAEDVYVNSEDRASLLARLREEDVVEGKRLRMQTLEGNQRWVETTLRLVEDNGQQYLDGVVQDVTERRERKQRLEESEMFFEHAQDGLFLIDVGDEFRVQRVNPAYEELTGIDAERVIGRTPTDIFGDEIGRTVESRYRECVQQRDSLEYEERLVIDGDPSVWATRITPVLVDDEVKKIVGSTRNITDRKERERELKRNKRRFEAILNDSHVLMGLLDTDGTILDANDTAMEYIDAQLADVLGTELWEAPWWSDEHRHVIEDYVKRAAAGEDVSYEADLTYPDGEPYYVIGVVRPVYDAADDVVSLVISARDITERKKREQQLDAMDRVLRHNLHNDMNIILGAAETITNRVDGDVADLAELIRTSGQQLLELTDKQRDIVDLVSEDPEPTSLDMTLLLRRVVTELTDTYPAAEISLTVPEDVQARTIPQFARAVRELIENAIIHAESDSPSVVVSADSTPECVRISVSDSGPSIPSTEQAILRGEGEKGPLYHGSGMGFWLVNWIVSASNGRVTCEQSGPSGNIVTIELPTAIDEHRPGRTRPPHR